MSALNKLLKLAKRLEIKLAQSNQQNDPTYQQWVRSVNQVGEAIEEMLQFWVNFLANQRFKSPYSGHYAEHIALGKKLQAFTPSDNWQEIWQTIDQAMDIHNNAILADCTLAKWFQTVNGQDVWRNKEAETAFYLYKNNYARNFLARAREQEALFEKVVADMKRANEPSHIVRDAPF